MQAIHSKDTKPEIYLRKLLFSLGYRYRSYAKNIPSHPDIYLRKYNTAIFINGCFWHRHKNCKFAYMPKSNIDFWKRKFCYNVERDKKIREQLMDRKTKQLVIWECSIKKMKRDDNVRQNLALHKQFIATLQRESCVVDAIKLDAIIQRRDLQSNQTKNNACLAQIKLLRADIEEILLQLDPSAERQIHRLHFVAHRSLSLRRSSVRKQRMREGFDVAVSIGYTALRLSHALKILASISHLVQCIDHTLISRGTKPMDSFFCHVSLFD